MNWLRSLAAHPAGRAANPRSPAFSGATPRAGIRAAGDYLNPFLSTHVPALWNALTGVFAREVDYWIDGDAAQAVAIQILWLEGAEAEATSPGRYSHAYVWNEDLPRPPRPGDVVFVSGVEYDVGRVDAYLTGISLIVMQDRSEVF